VDAHDSLRVNLIEHLKLRHRKPAKVHLEAAANRPICFSAKTVNSKGPLATDLPRMPLTLYGTSGYHRHYAARLVLRGPAVTH
jgi:hypothetical protein